MIVIVTVVTTISQSISFENGKIYETHVRHEMS
jgi:hypothetical protein